MLKINIGQLSELVMMQGGECLLFGLKTHQLWTYYIQHTKLNYLN